MLRVAAEEELLEQHEQTQLQEDVELEEPAAEISMPLYESKDIDDELFAEYTFKNSLFIGFIIPYRLIKLLVI